MQICQNLDKDMQYYLEAYVCIQKHQEGKHGMIEHVKGRY